MDFYNGFQNLKSVGIYGKTEKLVSYIYKDGNGRLKEVAYANGDVLKITYNRFGQVNTEKWYNAAGTLVAHYKYSYDNQENVVRSIDFIRGKEYDYLYDEDQIVRATECDITVNESGMVVGKSLVNMIMYKYDSDGKLVSKQLVSKDGIEQKRVYTVAEEFRIIF